ncbi:helix-turn-helix domain-containing protein [Streptomyces europaeiscabiei]|uniref:helix-turn-helix domain-containing protein n=1 Tax=Streptomyces europaeiscabiei TaxID=146819 RepID=UPI0029B182C8|nr:helix-turn-helix domain-containing protein [Streptomyces europaeiscabiei]MDX3691839.1 helix-turn-helix domain-containing protein [Streptomyces europaeiscabiei]
MSIGNSPDGNFPEDERPFEDDRDERMTERPSIGRALQQARIAAGLTVDDVSNATRVRIAIVHAIEQDDFAPCGGDVYARGHLRTLARAVRTDPVPLLEQFDEAHGGRPAPTPAAPMFEAERIRPERRGPNWTAAMVAAIVAVIGFVGFTAFDGGDDGDATQVAEGSTPTTSKPASPTPKADKPDADPKPDPTDSAIAAAPRDKVTVRVSASDGRSWISAKDHNGRFLWDGLLKQGESKTFQDGSKIDLVLGDAGAVQLYVNGKKIEDDFQPGQVERLTYTKGDPEVG